MHHGLRCTKRDTGMGEHRNADMHALPVNAGHACRQQLELNHKIHDGRMQGGEARPRT